jgi:hypothetical protein
MMEVSIIDYLVFAPRAWLCQDLFALPAEVLTKAGDLMTNQTVCLQLYPQKLYSIDNELLTNHLCTHLLRFFGLDYIGTLQGGVGCL